MGEGAAEFKKIGTYQALLAEGIGTGLLTLAALLAGTPYAVALILAALVYALGPISGAQLNPAVTLGLLAARRLPLAKGGLYLVAQAAGAVLAGRVAPSIGAVGTAHAGRPIGEFVGAGLLVLTVVAVSDKWVPKAGGGVAIGAALGAGLLLSGGVLNPAVALALGLGRSPATWAAALGGIAFAALFDLLSIKQGQEEKQGKEHYEDPSAPRPAAPVYRPDTPVAKVAPSVRVTAPRARPAAQRPATVTDSVLARLLRSAAAALFGRKGKQRARREALTRQVSGD